MRMQNYLQCGVCLLAEEANQNYDEGRQVWRTAFNDPQQMKNLVQIAEDGDIELWHIDEHKAEYVVRTQNNLKSILDLRGLDHEVLIPNLEEKISSQKVTPDIWDKTAMRVGHRLNWKTYPTLKVIDEYLAFLAQHYPSLCKVEGIGVTSENRNIQMLTISNGNPTNKVMLLVSGVHAREWAAITSLLYIINEIVTTFEDQSSFIKNKDWYILPVLNPDGFQYTQTVDRLWIKNRRKQSFLPQCQGVNLNRNFEIDWNYQAKLDDTCKETYSGTKAFSEPESFALRKTYENISRPAFALPDDFDMLPTTSLDDMILTAKRKPSAFVDIHSYGQSIKYPWSGRPGVAPDHVVMEHVAKGMAKRIFNATKHEFKISQSYQPPLPETGALVDWVYSSGVQHSFLIETMDDGKHAFLLPPEEIESAAKDVYTGVRYLAGVLEADLRREDDWF